MLVLNCDIQACIRVNDDVNIHILDIQSRSIKLGIEDLGNIPINREEIYEAIEAGKYTVLEDRG